MFTRTAFFLTAVATGFVAISAPATHAMAAGSDHRGGTPMRVCPSLTSGKIDTSGEPRSITVTPPAGMMITGYCVKAGSTNAGDGPVITDFAKPVTKLTFTHPSGKAISHYSVAWEPTPKQEAKNQDPKLPPSYAPSTETPTKPSAPSTPTGSTEPTGHIGSTTAAEARFPDPASSTDSDDAVPTLVSHETTASQVSEGGPSSGAQVLPNTGASTNGLLAALGALLVGAGVWLTRKARA